MNHFKKENRKLEKKRFIFFQIGLIIACGLTLAAFEWTTPVILSELPGVIIDETDYDYDFVPPIEIIKEKPIVKMEPPKAKSKEIEIVPNDYKEIKKEGKTEEKSSLVFNPEEWKPVEKNVDPPLPLPSFVSKMPHYASCAELSEIERKHCTQDKMYAHFNQTIRIPEMIKIRGKAVYHAFVYFVVNKKGEIVNVKILNDKKHKIPKEIEHEAYNAVKTLPKMIPGNNYGKKVSVMYKVPITFTVI